MCAHPSRPHNAPCPAACGVACRVALSAHLQVREVQLSPAAAAHFGRGSAQEVEITLITGRTHQVCAPVHVYALGRLCLWGPSVA